MITNKHINLICIITSLFMVLITILFINGETLGIKVVKSPSSYEARNISIDLNNISSLSFDYAYSIDGDLYIGQSGTYTLTGSLEKEKSIIINAKNYEVKLVLDNVTIENDSVSPIICKKANKLIISSSENSSNTLIVNNSISENGSDANAVIYSKSDIVLEGSGEINVYGYNSHSIRTNDSLYVNSGTYNIIAGTSKNNSTNTINGNSSSNESTESNSGDSNTLENNTESKNQIQSETNNNSNEKDVKPDATSSATSESHTKSDSSEPDGTSSATNEFNNSDRDGSFDKNNRPNDIIDNDGDNTNTDNDINNSGDNRSRPKNKMGGSQMGFGEDSGYDGLHSNDILEINGGNINILQSGEGIESEKIIVNDGNVSVVATDDGFNASTDGDTSDCLLQINGGYVYVDSSGDGLDSNYDLEINGGEVIVNGPTNDGNGALDSGSESGGKLTSNGGTTLAIGSSGMAETFTTSSKQPSFKATFSEKYKEGDELIIKDSSDNILYSYTIKKSGNSVIFSSPSIVEGETYKVNVGELSVDVIATIGEEGSGMGGMRNNNGERMTPPSRDNGDTDGNSSATTNNKERREPPNRNNSGIDGNSSATTSGESSL